MKIIKYRIMTLINCGTDKRPDIRQIFTSVAVPYAEKNMELARQEAYNGEISVEEDTSWLFPEPVPTADERLNALEAAMLAMMGGMTSV